MRGVDVVVAQGADGVVALLVGDDEDDIGLIGRHQEFSGELLVDGDRPGDQHAEG